MSKELEALEFICKILKGKGIDIKWLFKEQYNTIKQRLESIDNSNPSEALEKLLDGYSKGMAGRSYYDIIKQYILKAQEQEKVLDIIKEKNVDIIRIRHLIFKSQKNPKYWDLRYYNEARVIDDEKLTQEEFDLLKEVFK